MDAGAVETNQFVVTNTSDSGAGSLRTAITNADGEGMGDITFASGVSGTIAAVSQLPGVSGQVNVLAPLTPAVTVSGSRSHEAFAVDSGADSFLYGFTISNGSSFAGAGLYNDGQLTLSSMTVSGNSTFFSSGGGIYNDADGVLVVNQSTISGNSTRVGDGAGIYSVGSLTRSMTSTQFPGNSSSFGTGGGIYSLGNSLSVNDSTVSGNSASPGSTGGIWSTPAANLANSIVSGNASGDTGGGLTTMEAGTRLAWAALTCRRWAIMAGLRRPCCPSRAARQSAAAPSG